MRTTIEIDDVHRGKLLELAARRGEKGFSRIIAEAIESYLKSVKRSESVRRDALKLQGAFSPNEADRLRVATSEIRRSWR
ncbi:MAG: hypothetical protein ACREQL_09985 [Candidatus Binatia bacterium]